MKLDNGSFNAARRQVLKMFGIGAAGVAVGSIAAADSVFAKQFACEVTKVKVPKMTYDPNLQMMVDPATRKPIYSHPMMLASDNATVTAGCDNCPKCDDNCTD